MKDILKVGIILFITSAVAATCLAAVYSVTKPRIIKTKQMEFTASLSLALPGADPDAIIPVEKDGKILFYKGFFSHDTSKLVGYAYTGRSSGYSGVIETLVGVDSAGQVIGIRILSQVETPGLGSRIQEKKYGDTLTWVQKQFIGKMAAACKVDRDGGEIVSITGATISSRAVAKSVSEGYNQIVDAIAP
jgi:Na+-translocating ferredoxin:NAD+ oxidoreductase subunit G